MLPKFHPMTREYWLSSNPYLEQACNTFGSKKGMIKVTSGLLFEFQMSEYCKEPSWCVCLEEFIKKVENTSVVGKLMHH